MSSTLYESWPTDLGERYTPISLIAMGGKAAVYRARDESLGRDVAVKLFKSASTTELDFREQEIEVNVLARLSHPNLVTLFDAAIDYSSPDEPRVYCVMELVDGTDLKLHLDRGPLRLRDIALIGYRVAAALEYVHGMGIVHRDVKPANIMVTGAESGRLGAKLADFGIASIGPALALEDDELVTGTVAYLSPEQAKGDPVGSATDIYSLGLVLLQCMTAELAFPGPPQHSAMSRLIDDPVIPDDIPERWRGLIRAMTERDPAQRPDIRDAALALRELEVSEFGRHKSAPESQRTGVDRGLTDKSFDRITSLATRILGAPVALVSITGYDRVWLTARDDLDMTQIGIDAGESASELLNTEPVVLSADRGASETVVHPLIAAGGEFQFYAGVPLIRSDGALIGTLCVLDTVPRVLEPGQLPILQDLAAMAVRELDFEIAAKDPSSV